MQIKIKTLAASGRSINGLSETKGEFYCGRGSALGNPYHIGPDGDRNDVCDKFAAMFKAHLAITPREVLTPLKNRLLTIYRWGKENPNGVITLWCYCAPQRCHTETIRDWLLEKLK